MSEDRFDAALNLMRRMPPAHRSNNLSGLVLLAPDLEDDLIGTIDQPLTVQKDPSTGKYFIECEYNRDGDAFRSPWSDKYYADGAEEEGASLPPELRAREVTANHLFDIYRKLYFDTGVSSVYMFEPEDEKSGGYGACFAIHKQITPEAGDDLKAGIWDSVHVFSVTPAAEGKFTFELVTTVMVSLNMTSAKAGKVDLSGTMEKRKVETFAITKDKTHVAIMGGMLEKMELLVRQSIEGIYIQKTRQIINGMRSASTRLNDKFDKVAQSLAHVLSSKSMAG